MSLLFFQSDFGAKLQNVKCFASCVDLWKFACLRFLSKYSRNDCMKQSKVLDNRAIGS